MAVRQIRLYGDPVLKTACDPIKEFNQAIQGLVEDLIDTTKVPGRAGVAANQIGISLRAFSFNVENQVGYLLNPENLEVFGEPELIDEGCLSLPGLWHQTLRYPEANLTGYQLDGSTITVSGSGVLAQALQHELDHLNGLVYLDRLTPAERKLAMASLRETDWFLR
ncbi:MAG: peptide deformylase [Microbacteriaceae bacterium]|nr:peptide deformylase [Microbacteriaceae bacterium]